MLRILSILAAAVWLPQTASASPLPQRVDRFLEQNLDRTGLPGVAAVVVQPEGAVYAGGYGRTSSGALIDADTPFHIGSLSKSMTAFAVMQLADRGKLQLDQPVWRYVPEFRPRDPRARRITIRQLLTHTSGLSDGVFPEMSAPQPRNLAAAAERLNGVVLRHDPGAAWNYHNPNYHLLARAVEVASGQPFADYLRDEIFRPAGMTRTTTVLLARERSEVARGFVPIYGVMTPQDLPQHFVGGSGGVVSTARDLGIWLSLHLSGGISAAGQRLISAESLQRMHAPGGGAAGNYGFGWDEDRLPNGITRSKHGGLLFTFSADQAIFSNGYGVALLFNSAHPSGGEQMSFIAGLEALVLDETPALGSPVSRYVDFGLGALAAALALVAVWQIRRARRWARFWTSRGAVLLLLRGLVGLSPVIMLALLPRLVGALFGGRDVTWPILATCWPALVITFLAPAAGALAIAAARLRAIARQPERRA